MQALFDSGRVIDLIVALMVVEAVALTMLYRMTGRGIAPARLWPNLLAGAFLMLALRAALTGASVMVIGSCLFMGLAGHLADLAVRWSHHAAGPWIRGWRAAD